MAKTLKPAKPKKPAWQDSTYLKQISFYDKLKTDYAAEELRKKNELATYYGTEGVADKKVQKGTVKQRTLVGWKKVKGKRVPVFKVKTKPLNVVEKGKPPTEGLYQRELREQRLKDLQDILDDYASRGILRSGLYAQKRGDYETEFGKQLSETNRQRLKQYGDLAAEARQFAREQELQREQARLDAIRRRAAETGQLVI